MNRIILLVSAILIFLPVSVNAQEEAIDASDPTKIYTYAGGGVKYTDYTNGDSMWEIRATGNIGLSKKDMLLFELGYGWHDGSEANGTKDGNDLTNSRLRWFHIFGMDYSVTRGYRGWATQLDLQIAGSLVGTDGQNVVTAGALPAFGLTDSLSLFVALNWVNSWDKDLENYNGMGLGIAPALVYTPDWWTGSYVQIWPNYTRFFTDELAGEGAGNLDVTTGGSITPKLLWSVTFQQNLDKDLKTFRRGGDTGLKNDWNMYFNITSYF